MSAVDKHLDAVLRASGSALRHYSMQKTLDDMRAAMNAAMEDAAAAEREACAKVLRDAAERLAPSGKRTNMADRHTAEILSHYADAIRDRGNQPGGAHG